MTTKQRVRVVFQQSNGAFDLEEVASVNAFSSSTVREVIEKVHYLSIPKVDGRWNSRTLVLALWTDKT
jgi:hypothetical protein